MGEISYAPLNYNPVDKTLIATMDKTWLDKATYPVTVDPEMGYHSTGVNNGQYLYGDANVADVIEDAEPMPTPEQLRIAKAKADAADAAEAARLDHIPKHPQFYVDRINRPFTWPPHAVTPPKEPNE